MASKPPLNKLQYLAKGQSDSIEAEITKIQKIDHKVQHDIKNLKERLKMKND